MEDKKREKFEKIAARRVQNILYSLESLSKCSNKTNYSYTDEDIKKMMNAIKAKVKAVESAFTGISEKKSHFKF